MAGTGGCIPTTHRRPTVTNEAATARPYFGRVDSIRGLGALAVAGVHFSGSVLAGRTLLPHLPWTDASWFQNFIGRIGLACLPGHGALMTFFVISGFVLRVSLDYGPRSIDKASAKFFLSRLFRIVPLVVLGATVAALLVMVGLTGHSQRSTPLTMREWLANVCLLDISLNGHLWALQVEAAMVPVILTLYLLERRLGRWTLPIVAVVTTVLSVYPSWFSWRPLSTNLYAFVVGMSIPIVGRPFVQRLSRGQSTWLMAGACAVLFVNGIVSGLYARVGAMVDTYAAAALLSVIAYRPDVRALSVLDRRVLRRLGSASGSYYVFHMASAPFAMAVILAVVPTAWSRTAPGLVGCAIIAVWLVAIIPVMFVVSSWVETPSINFGRRVFRKLGLESESKAVQQNSQPLDQPAARAA